MDIATCGLCEGTAPTVGGTPIDHDPDCRLGLQRDAQNLGWAVKDSRVYSGRWTATKDGEMIEADHLPKGGVHGQWRHVVDHFTGLEGLHSAQDLRTALGWED